MTKAMNDPALGKLDYDWGWFKYTTIDFSGKATGYRL